MGVNKTDLLPKFKIAREIAETKRATQTMKQTQLVGGDSIVVEGTPLVSVDGVTLASGASTGFIITFTPALEVLMSVDCYVTIYVDNADDDNYRWLTGASLSASQKQLRRSLTPDWAISDDTAGIRRFILTVENYSPDSHTYYVRIKCYAPKNPAATS